MRTLMIAAAMAATLSTLLLSTTPALALNGKSWVANNGSAGNNCATPATACRTFQHAHDQTSPGGEIGVVNAGDYGQLSITKAISITNDSAGEAGLLDIRGFCRNAFTFDLVDINASAGDIVSLRGLVFEGCGGLTAGLVFRAGAALHIQNCVFRDFQTGEGGGAGTALMFTPAANSRLFISESIFLNSGTVANTGGILIEPLSNSSADVVFEGVLIEDNVVGLRLDSTFPGSNGIHAVLRDSVVSSNSGDGISVLTQAGKAPAFLIVESSAVFGNGGNGIVANSPGATVLLSDSTITRNGTGVSAVNGGQIFSYGNNRNNNNVGPEGTATGFLSAKF